MEGKEVTTMETSVKVRREGAIVHTTLTDGDVYTHDWGTEERALKFVRMVLEEHPDALEA